MPWFWAISNQSKLKAFLLSYLTGIIFWSGIIYWLVHVTFPGTILLILYLALYFGIFGILVSLIPGRWSLAALPAIWVILEFLRSHFLTGFPWALLGYSQYLNLPIIQIADISGVWGVSFLLMLVNVAVYQTASKIRAGLVALFCIAITLTYGYYRLSHKPQATSHKPMKISVIQGNIPQELKWNADTKDFILQRYVTLTTEALDDKPDLIIWPEAALPVVAEEEPAFLEKVKDLARRIKIPLLLGAVTQRDNRYYNSALLISEDGALLQRYDKLHLVPFGEYIPLRGFFSFLETVVPIGDFTAGKEYTIFNTQDKFSVLICFEDLFPELSRRFIKQGADFLINITNDAWFQKTTAPYQHLQASVFRAVENRVFVVRAANTGVSGFITPSGKIISLVRNKQGRNIFISGYLTQQITP